ncbi:MAG: hypothetical protein ACOYD4_16015 [Solirubrobacterales bacterium]
MVASAAAKGVTADLRVVGAKGKVLAEEPVTGATTSVKTSPKATCFGKGTGGSGKAVSIAGNTAMGLLARASKSTSSLSPLSISDSFDFGLALCGIGGSVAKGKSSWYLKINHKSLSVGGDQAKIHAGDEVLWDLAPSYPYPNELALVAPEEAAAGLPFEVRAYSYDEKGKRKPAAGVKVTGATGTTGSDGKAMVVLAEPGLLAATKSGEIPAARVAVCIGGKCPAAS